MGFDRGLLRATLGGGMITHYCERGGPGWFEEPVNTLTNGSFPVAAWLAWKLAREHGGGSRGVRVLILLAALIGVGSGIYHATGVAWAMVLDLLPIYFFQVGFLWLYLQRVVGMSVLRTAGWVGCFLALSAAAGLWVPPYLNRSLSYAPALLWLAGLGVWHGCSRQPASWDLARAAGLFLAALFFRTIDPLVCGVFPIGTHFLWHLLNGWVVYLAMKVLILHESAAVRKRSPAANR
jgi:hypothetical protein